MNKKEKSLEYGNGNGNQNGNVWVIKGTKINTNLIFLILISKSIY